MIFLDGKMVEADAVLMESLAPGVVEGKGVFETMKVYQGRILFLQEHLVRMQRGLKLYGLRQPYSLEKIKKYFYIVIQRNGLKNARIRISVWRKEGRDQKHMAIVAQATPIILGARYRKGITAMITLLPRPKTHFSHIKSLDYRIFREAFIEAKAKGYDEAILLNNREELVEGATSNIFFIKKGTLHTPATRCGCLNGITRNRVLQCAKKLGISSRIVFAHKSELFNAEEAFITNSLLGVMPLTRVDSKKIGTQRAGKITMRVLNAYQKFQISGS